MDCILRICSRSGCSIASLAKKMNIIDLIYQIFQMCIVHTGTERQTDRRTDGRNVTLNAAPYRETMIK